MDQLKTVFKALWKHRFWVLCSLSVLLGLGAWFWSTSTLGDQFSKRKQKLDGDFNAMRTLRGEANPPNQKVVEAIQKSHATLKDKVLQAWEILFKEQEKKNPWPQVLGQEFLTVIKSLKPDDEIPVPQREVYQNFIARRLATLRETIDVRRAAKDASGAAKPPAPPAARSGMGVVEQPLIEKTGIVEWNESNLQRIENRYKWSTQPTTLQVRYAQEDLWVYESLARILKNTNEGATRHYNAYVKRIESLDIGQDASAAWVKANATRLDKEKAATTGEAAIDPATGAMQTGVDPAAPEAAPAVAPEEESTEIAEQPVDEASAAAAEDPLVKSLKEGRYVNHKGRPLRANSKHPFAEFKMMPMHMRLVMDQTKIPKLLAECANSNMPVEVRRLQVKLVGIPGKPNEMPTTGATTAAVASAAEGHEGQPGATPAVTKTDDLSQRDVEVELFGIIYIINPPDRDKLGTGSAGQTPAAAEQPAAEPAATAVETPAAPAGAAPATPPTEAPATPAPAEAAPATPPTTPSPSGGSPPVPTGT